jgi:hypothetical protein
VFRQGLKVSFILFTLVCGSHVSAQFEEFQGNETLLADAYANVNYPYQLPSSVSAKLIEILKAEGVKEGDISDSDGDFVYYVIRDLECTEMGAVLSQYECVDRRSVKFGAKDPSLPKRTYKLLNQLPSEIVQKRSKWLFTDGYKPTRNREILLMDSMLSRLTISCSQKIAKDRVTILEFNCKVLRTWD